MLHDGILQKRCDICWQPLSRNTINNQYYQPMYNQYKGTVYINNHCLKPISTTIINKLEPLRLFPMLSTLNTASASQGTGSRLRCRQARSSMDTVHDWCGTGNCGHATADGHPRVSRKSLVAWSQLEAASAKILFDPLPMSDPQRESNAFSTGWSRRLNGGGRDHIQNAHFCRVCFLPVLSDPCSRRSLGNYSTPSTLLLLQQLPTPVVDYS